MENDLQNNIETKVIPALVRYLCNVKCITESEIIILKNSFCKALNKEEFDGHLQSLISELKAVKEIPIPNAHSVNESGSGGGTSSQDSHCEGSLLKPLFEDDETLEMSIKKTVKVEKTETKDRNQVEEKPSTDNIQIKADNNEIERRIASFMSQKQEEVNEFNRREFSIGFVSNGDSCARTESLFTPRSGSRSHIKITKVVNAYGPQTQQSCTKIEGKNTSTQNIKQEESMTSIIENRLNEIETHTHLKPASKDLCARLKAIEERILFLESLSPEYFNQVPRRKYKRESRIGYNERNNTLDNHLSVTQIDSKINSLRDTLMRKHTLFS